MLLQILLNLARSIFEEQNNLECLVTKIMREAQDLLKCERCAVYLLDLDCCEAVSIARLLQITEPIFLQRLEGQYFLSCLILNNFVGAM